jgi:Fe-S-cluster-containing hydrogenase component 2
VVRESATKGGISGALPSSSNEVAKLIDVSKCIGCEACQSACLKWNDLVEPVGFNTGVHDNPHDLAENSPTLMRFTGDLEWLIREDGCMHCADPGCLKACRAPDATGPVPPASVSVVLGRSGTISFHAESAHETIFDDGGIAFGGLAGFFAIDTAADQPRAVLP